MLEGVIVEIAVSPEVKATLAFPAAFAGKRPWRQFPAKGDQSFTVMIDCNSGQPIVDYLCKFRTTRF
jgi:hypothetical protein